MLRRCNPCLLLALGLSFTLTACGSDPVVDTPGTDTDPTPTDTTEPTEPEIQLPFGFEAVTTTTCTLGARWKLADHGSRSMHPGRDCIDCHADERGTPDLLVAGTIMPSQHESDDCQGVAEVDVVIVDATGAEFRETSNAAGNFYISEADFADAVTPITARLELDGVIQAEMDDPQDTANCNACHTESGAHEAEGRITLTPR